MDGISVRLPLERIGSVSRVLALSLFVFASTFAGTVHAEPIRGAGSTFAAPVIAKWAEIYQSARQDGGDFVSPDWTVDYELVGSLAGVLRLDQQEMDFAATDVPIDAAELTKSGREQFPIVMGGIAVIVNIDGVAPGALRLTGPLLADIFLGKVKTWSDPAIKAVNPDLALPDMQISVVHRKDGSGSTFVFTEYLSAASAEWKQKFGADTLIAWPLGADAEGTQNLIRAVNDTAGAIAYAEFGQTERAGLAFALIENRAGNFARPDPEGVQAAAAGAAWETVEHFDLSLTDQPGQNAYPITTATFAVVPVNGRSADRSRRVHDFFRLAFERGATEARALSYVPLPDELAARVRQYWDRNQNAGN